MFNTIEAIPAYGRSYTSVAAMLEDWNAGKDFKLVGGSYFSSRDAKALVEKGYDSITIVWDLKNKTTTIPLT